MAYTDKDAIYEIAEKLGYTGDEGLTTTEAVYAVASALGYTGEHDKSVALALSDLKTVVGGGGGGGSYGPSMVEYGSSQQLPEAGLDLSTSATIGAIKAHAGNTLIYDYTPPATNTGVFPKFATGLTIDTTSIPAVYGVTCDLYACTRSTSSAGKVATARKLSDVEITRNEEDVQGTTCHYWSFAIAEGVLDDGELVIIYLHPAS